MNLKSSVFFSLLLLISCTKNDLTINDNKTDIYGEGDLTEKSLSLNPISEIENTGCVDIVISYGQTRSYTLKAQQNIMDIITINNSGTRLSIGTDQKYNIRNSKGVTLEVTSPDDINNISITGVGNVTYSKGHAGTVTFSITGVGNIYFNDFTADTCNINIAGVSNCYVTVNKLLKVNITGVGNVYYKGDAVLEQHLSGVASVTKGK